MTAYERRIVARAIAVLEKNAVYRHDDPLTSPRAAKQLAFLQLAEEPNEVFACLFLDNRHRMIAFEKVFFGSIDGATIHPRVIVQKALCHNAAAVILSHNHPSGITEPSREDQEITQRLKDALILFDVRILDHLIVGSRVGDTVSLAERGLL
jgi:DNA repair protein RadC